MKNHKNTLQLKYENYLRTPKGSVLIFLKGDFLLPLVICTGLLIRAHEQFLYSYSYLAHIVAIKSLH